jgi:hypothetical protein
MVHFHLLAKLFKSLSEIPSHKETEKKNSNLVPGLIIFGFLAFLAWHFSHHHHHF